MAEVAAVFVRSMILSTSAIMDSTVEPKTEQCYTHSSFRAGVHILVWFGGFVIWVCGVWCGGALSGACEKIRQKSPASSSQSSEHRSEDGGVSMSYFTIQEPEPLMLAEDPNCEPDTPTTEQQLRQMYHQQYRQRMQSLQENGYRDLIDNLIWGVVCFTTTTLLQFHDPFVTVVWGLTFLVLGFKDILENRISLIATYLSGISSILFLLSPHPHKGYDVGSHFSLAKLVSIVPPMIVTGILVSGARSTGFKEIVKKAMPVTVFIATFVVLIGVATEKSCSDVDVVSEWKNGISVSYYNTTIVEAIEETREDIIFLTLFWPVNSFLSMVIILKGLTTDHSTEIGVGITMAAAVKYAYVKSVSFGANVKDEMVFGSMLLVMSWVSTICIALERWFGSVHASPRSNAATSATAARQKPVTEAV